MAMGDLYDSETGAQYAELFGCVVKSISAEHGKGQYSAKCTVVVVQESGQEFSLVKNTVPNDGLEALVYLTVGNFVFTGIVKEWDKTVTSMNGENIYTVKMADARTVLNNAMVVFNVTPTVVNYTQDFSDTGGLPPIGTAPPLNKNTYTSSPPSSDAPPNVVTIPSWLTDRPLLAGGGGTGGGTGGGQGGVAQPGLRGASSYNDAGNVIPVEPTEPTDLTHGARYDIIAETINGATLWHGDIEYRVDVSDLTEMVKSLGQAEGDNIATSRSKITSISLAHFIQWICNEYSLDWYTEIMFSEDVPVIVIRVRDNSIFDDATPMTFDEFADLHDGEIILRKEGYTYKTRTSSKIMAIGPHKEMLVEYPSDELKPFWGWEPEGGEIQWQTSRLHPWEEGEWTRIDYQPLESPKFHCPGEPDDVLRDLTIEQMDSLLRGHIPPAMSGWSIEERSAARAYAKKVYGRQFYIQLPDGAFTIKPPRYAGSTRYRLEYWINLLANGWWEGDGLPVDFNSDGIAKFCTANGRWIGFARLPRLALPITEDISTEEELAERYIYGGDERWDAAIINSADVVVFQDDLYCVIKMELYDNYILITTGIPLITRDESSNRGRKAELSAVWIPYKDLRTNYGPWHSDDLLTKEQRRPGKTEIINDIRLAPWIYGKTGMTHEEAMRQVDAAAWAKVGAMRPNQGNASTGQLEIAGEPRVNLGTLVGSGGARVDQLSIQYNTNGITTRYNINRVSLAVKEQQQRYYEQEKKAALEEAEEMEELENPDDPLHPPTPPPPPVTPLRDPPPPSNDPDEPDDLEGEDPSNPWNNIDGWEPEEFEDVEEPPTFGEIAQEISRINFKKKKRHLMPLDKPDGGLGLIMTGPGLGPYYDIRRLDGRDISQGVAEELLLDDMLDAPTWINVRNLAEDVDSAGYLQAGTRVTVKMFVDTYVVYEDLVLDGSDRLEPVKVARYTPYIEHTPTTFAPPQS